MATANDVITGALLELGVLAEAEVPTAAQAADGLIQLNNLIDGWAAERLEIYTITRTTWTITSNVGTYLVGTGQVVNVARPVFLSHINFIDTAQSPNYEYQMGILTDDAYAALAIKAQTAVYPQTAYYNPTFTAASPYGTIILWPIPTSATLLGVLYAPQAVAELAALTTTVLLPPGYKRMFLKNLALELAPSYQREISPALVQQAREAKETVKRSNKRLADLNIDMGALVQGVTHRWGYGYSIYQG